MSSIESRELLESKNWIVHSNSGGPNAINLSFGEGFRDPFGVILHCVVPSWSLTDVSLALCLDQYQDLSRYTPKIPQHGLFLSHLLILSKSLE